MAESTWVGARPPRRIRRGRAPQSQRGEALAAAAFPPQPAGILELAALAPSVVLALVGVGALFLVGFPVALVLWLIGAVGAASVVCDRRRRRGLRRDERGAPRPPLPVDTTMRGAGDIDRERLGTVKQLHELAVQRVMDLVSLRMLTSDLNGGSRDGRDEVLRELAATMRRAAVEEAEVLRRLRLILEARRGTVDEASAPAISRRLVAGLSTACAERDGGSHPAIDVTVDDGLVLEWMTETVLDELVRRTTEWLCRDSSPAHLGLRMTTVGARIVGVLVADGYPVGTAPNGAGGTSARQATELAALLGGTAELSRSSETRAEIRLDVSARPKFLPAESGAARRSPPAALVLV